MPPVDKSTLRKTILRRRKELSEAERSKMDREQRDLVEHHHRALHRLDAEPRQLQRPGGAEHRLFEALGDPGRVGRFAEIEFALAGHIGTRTKDMGKRIHEALTCAGIADKAAREWARQIAAKAGLSLYSQERIDAIERAATAQRIAKKRREIEVLRMGGTVR